MSVTDALDAMRSELPGCACCLCRSEVETGSEHKCRGASRAGRVGSPCRRRHNWCLDGMVAEGAAPVWAEAPRMRPCRCGDAFECDRCAGFPARAMAMRPKTLICVCAPDSDLARVVVEGRAALKLARGSGVMTKAAGERFSARLNALWPSFRPANAPPERAAS